MKQTNEKGITLVSLVITIIVMLILAGVSLSTVVGEGSVLENAKRASFATRMSSYAEAYELKVGGMLDEKTHLPIDRTTLTVYNPEEVKKYVTNLDPADEDKFKILNGELCYVGEDELEKEIANGQAMRVATVDDIERESVDVILNKLNGNAFTTTNATGDTSKAGVELKNKVLGQEWKIIIKMNGKEAEATYGTGWYFVEAGTKTDQLGVLKRSYILNYTDRKAVVYDEAIHRQIAHDSNLAIKDGIVLNIDPSNMTEGESSWGNVSVKGFNKAGEKDASGNVISGWFGSGIRFDGVDDYIEFQSGSDFSKGFTLSFYGKQLSNSFPFFCKQIMNKDGTADIARSVRFHSGVSSVSFNVSKNVANATWSGKNENNGILTCPWSTVAIGDDVYVDVVCDPVSRSDGKIVFTAYRDGKKIGSTVAIKSYWHKTGSAQYSGKTIMEDSKETCRIGSYYGGNPAKWSYGATDLYAVRLYNKVLTDAEIEANYTATITYHATLRDPSTGGTGGETGGTDFDDVVN